MSYAQWRVNVLIIVFTTRHLDFSHKMPYKIRRSTLQEIRDLEVELSKISTHQTILFLVTLAP